jgi:hypothetical protein
MWDWLRKARERRRRAAEARREKKIAAWLKAHPDRIKIDARRMKEWSRPK